MPDTPVDYEMLAQFLDALAYPVRLELLHKLRFPQTVGEIEVTPHRRTGGGNPDRPLARQSVQGHLDKLVAAGLVRSQRVEHGGKPAPAYQVDPARLYAVIEDMRRLSVLYAGRGARTDATGTLDTNPEPERVTGPRLVLVHGVYEGKAFPLTADTAVNDVWTVGRDERVPVSLDYDPFVSQRNSVVRRDDGGFVVQDLPKSKNGTAVNWHPVPSGGEKALRTGDVIGVGRSLLSFVRE